MKKLRKRDKYVIAAVLNLCWYCIAVLVLTAHDKVVPDSLTHGLRRGRRNWRCWRESKSKERTNNMNELLNKRIANLLSVKSLVTIALTATFCALTVQSKVTQEFNTVYLMVIAFYFGTQNAAGSAKGSDNA